MPKKSGKNRNWNQICAKICTKCDKNSESVKVVELELHAQGKLYGN